MKAKFLTAVLLTGAIIAPHAVMADSDSKYSDMDNSHWAYGYVSKLSGRGVISGYEDGSFKPEATVSRAEWAKMMITSAGLSIPGSEEQFKSAIEGTDISENAWYASYMAASKDYLNTYNDNEYRPEAAAAREDVTASLVKIMDISNDNADLSSLAVFSDSDSISDSVKSYVAVAVQKGLISGFEDGTFRGQNTLTRAEAAVLLCKAFGMSVNEGGAASMPSAPAATANNSASGNTDSGISNGGASGGGTNGTADTSAPTPDSGISAPAPIPGSDAAAPGPADSAQTMPPVPPSATAPAETDNFQPAPDADPAMTPMPSPEGEAVTAPEMTPMPALEIPTGGGTVQMLEPVYSNYDRNDVGKNSYIFDNAFVHVTLNGLQDVSGRSEAFYIKLNVENKSEDRNLRITLAGVTVNGKGARFDYEGAPMNIPAGGFSNEPILIDCSNTGVRSASDVRNMNFTIIIQDANTQQVVSSSSSLYVDAF